MGRTAIYSIAAVMFVILTVAAMVTGGIVLAGPILLVGVITFAYLFGNDWMASRALDRHEGDVQATQGDSEEPLPATHAIADDATALGDTGEAHAEVSPHDFPKDSPQRAAAEAQVASESGTTRGNVEGADDEGGRELSEEEAPPSKGEGYPEGEPASSRGAR